ncbi:hypothetical protein FRC04_009793 [Tulasnella sp. 424]|nr:hypothetical protein FRC04_009793 [Tulasnella sp. 424]KAG8971160.1 hypothetical protein FRC05_011444 [Tulasnella sp. 425]
MTSQQQHIDSDAFLQPRTFERLMGDTELSYYLPSRADGANDMCMYLGFRAPQRLFTPRRVLATWALLLLRHPLLAARVIPPPSSGSPFETDYSSARFSYAAPTSPTDAIRKASALLEFQKGVSKDEIFDRYLNGKRLLGDNRLCYLIFTENSPRTENDQAEFSWFFGAAHFISDSVAFHQLANEFFTIIAGTEFGYGYTAMDLEELVRKEWQTRWGSGSSATVVLPSPVEERLPPVRGAFRKAAGRVDFLNSSRKDIGGHVLPRTKGAKRKAVVRTIAFDEATSRTILRKCKSQGVSFSNALFALCALAWTRTQLERGVELRTDLPIMMYTALNLRPYLLPSDSSYWSPALGFFNIILPSFVPSTSLSGDKTAWKALRSTFWQRARSAKAQTARATKHPLLVSRVRETARQRSETARAFAVEDDAKELGLPMHPRTSSSTPIITQKSTAPSAALFGLSQLGSLDGIYIHKDYPSVQLHWHAPATRIRPGGFLLFSYTFAGKLYLNLGYDVNGFKDGIVEAWWKDLQGGVEEFLIGKPAARL